MLNQLLTKLGLGDGTFNADVDTRRKYIRHQGLQAEVELADATFSVRDWSMGGVCFDTLPDARLVEGDKMNITLRFRFPHEVISIRQQARVVRAGKRGVAASFTPLNGDERKKFERVLDSYYAQNFLESQVA